MKPTPDKSSSPAQPANEERRKDQAPAADTTPPKRLDLDALDLSIEEVEERIHPSETNVFDK